MRDIEDVKQLQARFWYACDGDLSTGPTHDPEMIASLFTSDGSWTVSARDTTGEETFAVQARGRTELISCFSAYQEDIPFALHLGVTPLIEVAGDTALGKWKMTALLGYPKGEAYWSAATYDVGYQRTPEGWRIQRCTVAAAMHASYRRGWGEDRLSLRTDRLSADNAHGGQGAGVGPDRRAPRFAGH